MMKRFYVIIISIICSVMANAQNDVYYQLVTSTSELEVGGRYIIGSPLNATSSYFMKNEAGSNNFAATAKQTVTDGKVKLVDDMLVLTLGGSEGAWTFKTNNFSGTDGYLNVGSSTTSNVLKVYQYSDDKYSFFTMAFGATNGNVIITFTGKNSHNIMRFYSSGPSFSCYSSGQNDIYLYKEITAPTPQSLTLVAQSGANYYATFSSASAVEFTDAETTIYKVAPNGSENLTLTAIESKQIPANTGVLVKSSKTATAYKAITSAEAVSDNYMYPASEEMTGDNKFYKLAYNNYDTKTGLGFYYGRSDGGPFTAKAGGAYLAIPASQAKSGFVFGDDDVVTAIQITDFYDADDSAAAVYNLAGQRVRATTKGLLIINGRKLFNK